ncbi:hypothetical protein G5C51_29915 [Streptomyces sp. A7024]|uniref:Uncharacterized protein n=1 Tax=Streptomyces coryli TaxID=1128680 RepID=A0A6G4U7E7_9ACTN|nr:hypothetical protein [Streptomyces coryli]
MNDRTQLRGAVAVEDPRVQALQTAVSRLRRELAALPGELSDREAAEDELLVLSAMAHTGTPEVPRMRRSLLLIAGAVGSVSALSPALTEVREVIDLFGVDIPGQRRGD